MREDLRDACRGLWRAKPFTAAAVITLALGIAGTTVMFALLHGVLLRPLPVAEQDRLIIAWKEARTSASARYPFGSTEIEALTGASRLLQGTAGVTRNGVQRTVVTVNGHALYANVGLITGSFFGVLGAQPLLGRALSTDDDHRGAEGVVVVSHGFWQRQFGGAHATIGQRVFLAERPFTIVGVMPADLDYPSGVEIWQLTSSVPTGGPFGDAAQREINLVGRLRDGVTLEQATSEITTLSEHISAANAPMRDLVPVVRPFSEVLIGDVRTALMALFGAVALVLLIASANVANLLLMRGEARQGDLALRLALGAARGRLVRHVLCESLLLSMMGGIAGLATAWWSLQAIVGLIPDGLPRTESIRVDVPVVLFSVVVSFIAAVAAGVIPALLAGRVDLMSPLRGSGRERTGGRSPRGRRALVMTQVALAVTVLAASGLLVRSVLRLNAVDLGFDAERLVLLELYLPRAKYAERRAHAQLLDEIIARLETVPTVAAATPVNISPFANRGWDVPQVTVEGQTADEARSNPSLHLESIHPNYYATFDVTMRQGRAFTSADREGAVPVAIVSEDFAARLWPQGDALGKRLKMGSVSSRGGWYEIVGVAAPTRYRTVMGPRPTLYLPAAQFQMTATMLAVRTTGSLELVTSAAAERIGNVDADVPLMRVAPFAELLARPLARPRFNALLLGVFGVAALLLSTIGLYAVIAASARQRDREIAVRYALGASVGDVRRLVLSEACTLAGGGAVIGLVCAAIMSRFLRGMLFEIDALDPVSLIGAAAVLAAAAAVAAYAPVRRAARADIVSILRV